MTHWSKTLFQASIFFLSLGCSRSYADAKLDLATVSLLQRYETIVSARSKAFSQLRLDQPNQFGAKLLGLPFIYLMGALKSVGPDTLTTLERSSDAILTGARTFIRPAGLGMVGSNACFIALITPGEAPRLGAEFSKVNSELLGGQPAWTWTLPPSEGGNTRTTFYASIVDNSFFVLANDAEGFEDITKALAQNNMNADLLNDRDLTSLRAHDYWADPAIHRGKGIDVSASGLDGLPVSAVGLQLFTDLDDPRLFFNILVTDKGSGSGPATARLPSSDAIRFQRAGTGRWQAVISLTAGDKLDSTLAQVLTCFGYGLAL
jgi:hypothetical protein